MEFPAQLKYTKEHEWLRIEGDVAYVGITEFAQSELGDLVYVEINTIGEIVAKDDIFGTVEAVKTTSDLFMPVTGKVIEFNPAIDEKDGNDPTLINSDPYGKGWLVKIEIQNPSEIEGLLDDTAYRSLIGK
ncbi:MAG TPA: glycine cleavage system protein GcvH [Saprospiraceae bacterium]|jgi:glycine cleavage system H protein|nr:glycine cleavage system protein GcvH [Saprospiraceae bacterium]MBK8735131.1 glycine cleavage system protein GcvH [Saprospiraceae bacterium]HOJ90531.1 glycine cleavage system protein GcvH [Saprospiraceae bacterium]HUN16185.1 glycine cleavage system protein GcvH [Saprospiraceae bacterium]